MLSRLEIEGLAIIESLTIEFSPQFNVITGETGAGKSILIKALGILLGSKSNAETIRKGRQQAQVTGFFEVRMSHKALEIMDHYGIPWAASSEDDPQSEVTILTRRVISAKNKFLAWINDTPVTATVLREVGGALIDVFGQHDSLRLLDPGHHLQWLDQFLAHIKTGTSLGADSILIRYTEERKKVLAGIKTFLELVDEIKHKRQSADFLHYRYEELQKFSPSVQEYAEVLHSVKTSSHHLQVLRELQCVQALVDSPSDSPPVGQTLWECQKRLNRIQGISSKLTEKIGKLGEHAGQLATGVDELSYQLGVFIREVDIPESVLESAQERLVGYQELFRKLHVQSVEDLLGEMSRIKTDLTWLNQAEASCIQILKNLHADISSLKVLGEHLTKARQKAKDLVKKRLEKELHDLAMPGSQIDVEFSPVRNVQTPIDLSLFSQEIQNLWNLNSESLSHLGESGMERAQFLLSSNPGEPLHPLVKIASGGEISRVILALKRALSAGAGSCVLVFDEIDTGISGRVADVVGSKIKELSNRFQVICISHLAQVTAYCDAHFLVHKCGSSGRTESQIVRLSDKDSEKEIARLISGSEVTPASLNHARALLTKARQGKEWVDAGALNKSSKTSANKKKRVRAQEISN